MSQQEAAALAGAPDRVSCIPIPDWIEHRPYLSRMPETELSCVVNGTCRLLCDIQVDLSGAEFAWHSRTAQRVLTRTGAERVAHVVVEFDPAYQRIEVHFIRILRGEECIEHAKPGAFQMFRRETSLERLTLDGRLTASLLIPDVRIDDVVEIGLTIYGGTPVLAGRYAAWAAFDSLNPWFESRHRLVRPLARKIFVKEFNNPPKPEIIVNGDVEESRWHIVDQKRHAMEELTPPWLVVVPALQFSEFKSWNEVACLFASFYQDDAIPDALAEEIDRLVSAHENLEERAAEWLRFVQQKLRYFAFSFGEGGLVPRELEAIWGTRFGDCKDAAKLYIAGARRMGLDVCAALVSTTHGPALSEFVSSPAVFNHCIVRVCLNGISYWLDPTISIQSGSLSHVFQPHIGWALPLSLETTRLEKLNGNVSPHVVHWEEELIFGPKRESPAKFRRHIDHFFWAADMIRNRIANEGTAEYARTMLKDLQSVWPDTVESENIEVRDDQVRNCVTLILTYELRDCWKRTNDGKRLSFSVADPAFNGELSLLKGTSRRTDIYLGRPRKMTRYLRMDMPRTWVSNGWWQTHEVPGLRYVNRLLTEGRSISNSKELVIGSWSLPAAEASAYNEAATRLRENLLTIWARERFGKIRPITGNWLGISMKPGNRIQSVWTILWVLWLFLLVMSVLVRR